MIQHNSSRASLEIPVVEAYFGPCETSLKEPFPNIAILLFLQKVYRCLTGFWINLCIMHIHFRYRLFLRVHSNNLLRYNTNKMEGIPRERINWIPGGYFQKKERQTNQK